MLKAKNIVLSVNFAKKSQISLVKMFLDGKMYSKFTSEGVCNAVGIFLLKS